MSLILAVETSCDDTAAAVVKDGVSVLSSVIFSQTETHRPYGGVVPEIASRDHLGNIDAAVSGALGKAGAALGDIGAVAATYGPGLVGALLVGLSFAKGLAFSSGKPFLGVNHIKGHIAANFLENTGLEPPFICLVVSGGHTCIVLVKSYAEMEILGRTRDDAAGEAFDKAARALGFAYPGGAEIDRLAKDGDPGAVNFPRARLEKGSLDFSFSGLKTALIQYLEESGKYRRTVSARDVAASFQRAATDALAEKTMAACGKSGLSRLAVAGGVAANSGLRARLKAECDKRGIELFIPKPAYCTDNAAMIAAAAHFFGGESSLGLNAYPSLPL